MGTSGAAKIPMANAFVAENSETTVEINIKTLDSQTYTLRVNKCVSVPALKEQIATLTGVLSNQQRLICRGRVLKDDQLLSAYHVEDGHTLHLVVRQPHQSPSPFFVSDGLSINPANSVPDSTPNTSSQVSRTIVLEAFNVDQVNIDSTSLNRIMGSVMNSIRESNNTSGNVSTNVREANSERIPRPFSDSGASTTQNQLNIAQRIESDRQHEAFSFPSAVFSGSHNLPEIPHSLTTLRQYLAHLKNEFWREAPGCNAARDGTILGEASTVDHNRGDNASFFHRSSRRDDLPSPAALAEILLQTRQLLAEYAEECLLGLYRELENDTSTTPYLTRLNVQSSAVRTGFFLQNLGSLLLELGRTTMTLRMGQGPAEAVVNSGPAVFISASGPSPIMVQPVPFYPAPSFGGTHSGSTNSGHGPESERVVSSILPRNIDIRIHRVPIPAASQSGLSSAQVHQENSDSPRTSVDGESAHQGVQIPPHSTPLAEDYGFRVVPVRTVVAMPVGINNSQPDSSENLIPLLHPLLARIQHQNIVNVNGGLGPLVFPFHQSTFEANQDPIPDSVRQGSESYNEGSLQETQFPLYTAPMVSDMGIPPTAEFQQHGARAYISSQRDVYSDSSHINDGQNGVRLPQFLSRFNQFSSTHADEINFRIVDQQESAPGSHMEQASIDRDAELDVASRSFNDEGVFFSNFLRQLMPLLPQGTAITQEIHGANLSGASSSQHQRDPPESPSPKRHRGE